MMSGSKLRDCHRVIGSPKPITSNYMINPHINILLRLLASGNLELSLPKSARYMPGCSKSSCTCPIFWRYKAATLGNVRGATPASPSATAPEPSGAGPSADFSHEVGRTK